VVLTFRKQQVEVIISHTKTMVVVVLQQQTFVLKRPIKTKSKVVMVLQ
jgi:hypothetical protein